MCVFTLTHFDPFVKLQKNDKKGLFDMNVIVKMEQAYNCLENFRNNCGNEHKKLIDLFFPTLYEESKYRLEISVGKKKSEHKFQSFLSTITRNFVVKLGYWNNEPQFIIEDKTTRMSIVALNLALINSLHIEEEKKEDGTIFQYLIDFNYNNEVDYHINITY